MWTAPVAKVAGVKPVVAPMNDVNEPIPLNYARPPERPRQRRTIRLSFVLFCTLPVAFLILITWGILMEPPRPKPRPQPIPGSPEDQVRLNEFHQSGEMFNGQY